MRPWASLECLTASSDCRRRPVTPRSVQRSNRCSCRFRVFRVGVMPGGVPPSVEGSCPAGFHHSSMCSALRAGLDGLGVHSDEVPRNCLNADCSGHWWVKNPKISIISFCGVDPVTPRYGRWYCWPPGSHHIIHHLLWGLPGAVAVFWGPAWMLRIAQPARAWAPAPAGRSAKGRHIQLLLPVTRLAGLD